MTKETLEQRLEYVNKVNTILSLVTDDDDRGNLEKSLSLLRDLIHETESLIKY